MAITILDSEFEDMVREAMDGIPERIASKMQNIGFVIEDDPTPDQRRQLRLHNGQTLYGLYQGIPLTQRGSNYSGVLPDKITIFKNPMFATSNDLQELKAQVKNTVWHEVAHYFGLGHGRIQELENR